MGTTLIDRSGQRFGRLTVIRRANKEGEGRPRWLCRCDCGSNTVVESRDLRRYKIKSCGCYVRERIKEFNALSFPRLSHGDTRNGRLSPEYHTWASMIKRCTNRNCWAWKNYGGRGITVCDRWRDSFENFLADMGRRPLGRNGKRPLYTLDRINNDGHYEPGNCRWATWKEQAQNTRKAKHALQTPSRTLTPASDRYL